MTKKEMTKGEYISTCWICIFLGIIGNLVFSFMGITQGYNYYIAAYQGLSLFVIGVGIGLANAHAFKRKPTNGYLEVTYQ